MNCKLRPQPIGQTHTYGPDRPRERDPHAFYDAEPES